jgi:hypothetical protein
MVLLLQWMYALCPALAAVHAQQLAHFWLFDDMPT